MRIPERLCAKGAFSPDVSYNVAAFPMTWGGQRRATPTVEDEQLRLARLVQHSLLPPPLSLPRLELAARCLPSARVGGDFLDYFPLGPDHLGLYLGDVQGKGLEGALYALLISGLMRGLPKSGNDPVQVLSSLHQRLCFRSVPGKFCCLSYAVFDLEQRQLKYASAGLPFPLLLRRGVVTPINLTGSPVGLFDQTQYDQVALNLEEGDRLLFYTDGLSDCLRVLDAAQSDGGKLLEELFVADQTDAVGALADRFAAQLEGVQADPANCFLDDATFLIAQVR